MKTAGTTGTKGVYRKPERNIGDLSSVELLGEAMFGKPGSPIPGYRRRAKLLNWNSVPLLRHLVPGSNRMADWAWSWFGIVPHSVAARPPAAAQGFSSPGAVEPQENRSAANRTAQAPLVRK